MTFRAGLIIIASFICGTLSAQDVTGRWTGVADTTDEATTKRQEQQSFEIRTTDGKLMAVSIGRNGNPGRRSTDPTGRGEDQPLPVP